MGEPRMTMLPPAPDKCQECAADHQPEEPHNQGSLYYQMAFHAKHGRYPTWKDALEHCGKETQRAWKKALRERGVKV